MIFDVVNAVLTDLDDAGEGEYGDDWDAALAEQLVYLEGCYANGNLLVRDRELIDYGALSTQAAYVFMYMAGHADFIRQILLHARANKGAPLFPKGELRLGSLGGGPGSDLLGVVSYLNSKGSNEKINKIVYTIYDKESNWTAIVESTVGAISEEVEVELRFAELDVTDVGASKAINLAELHALILSFFISEVCEIDDSRSVAASINHLLASLSAGSFLLYNDSKTISFLKFFKNRVWAAKRFQELFEIDDDLSVSNPDLSDMIEEYMARFERTPKLSSRAVAKFYKRLAI